MINISIKELSDPNNYHEFCRLLARLKSNYQLGELVTVDNYQVGITVVADIVVAGTAVHWTVLAGSANTIAGVYIYGTFISSFQTKAYHRIRYGASS